MLNKFYCKIKIVAFLLIVLLSGCRTYRQFDNQFFSEDITRVTRQYIAIQNGHLEYYRFGSGSPIVLISGYATDVTSWNKQFLVTLAKQHQLIVFNNRNVGESYVQSNHYRSQDLAKDTHELIQKLHLKKPAVLGISMGGMIAQQLAALYPKEISRLILINTAIAGKQSVKPTPDTQKTMLNMPISKFERFILALKLFFPASARSEMGFALALERFKPEDYKEISLNSVIPQQRFLILQWMKDDITAKKLSRLHLPVLILNGLADLVIPPVNSDILAHTFSHAELIRWTAGGHAMIYQYPESIAKVINDFMGLRPDS